MRVATSGIGERTRPSGREERERRAAFARARRHSRLVSLMKVVLPLSALVMIGGFAGYTWMSAPVAANAEVARVAIEDGQLVMDAPRLEGFTKDNLAYAMTARRAVQDAKAAGVFELEDIDARLPISKDSWATVTSSRGIYDRDKNTIRFASDVSVSTTDGMEARFGNAFYDIGKGRLETREPVDIRLKGAEIAANGMSVVDNGKVLVFEDKVRMTIDPGRVRVNQGEGGGNGN